MSDLPIIQLRRIEANIIRPIYEEMVRHRLRQNNIYGPGGFLGIEDNEALKFVQDGLKRSMPGDGLAVLGDDGETLDTIITERAIRAMYRYYRGVMEL